MKSPFTNSPLIYFHNPTLPPFLRDFHIYIIPCLPNTFSELSYLMSSVDLNIFWL